MSWTVCQIGQNHSVTPDQTQNPGQLMKLKHTDAVGAAAVGGDGEHHDVRREDRRVRKAAVGGGTGTFFT